MDEDKINTAPDDGDYQSDDTACSAEFGNKGCKNPVSDAEARAACAVDESSGKK